MTIYINKHSNSGPQQSKYMQGMTVLAFGRRAIENSRSYIEIIERNFDRQ